MSNSLAKQLIDSVISKTFITVIGITGAIITIYAFLQEKEIDPITVNGQQRDVYKDPITDHGKKSFSGPMSLIYRDGNYHTLRGANQPGDLLETVYENGQLKRDMTLDKIRAIANDQVF